MNEKPLHHKSIFPASSGEDRGKHYCVACTYSVDDFTGYILWPCPTAIAFNNGEAIAEKI